MVEAQAAVHVFRDVRGDQPFRLWQYLLLKCCARAGLLFRPGEQAAHENAQDTDNFLVVLAHVWLNTNE
jgi:hypothetical protein